MNLEEQNVGPENPDSQEAAPVEQNLLSQTVPAESSMLPVVSELETAAETTGDGDIQEIDNSESDDDQIQAAQDEASASPEFDSLRALTSLLLGGAIEGTSQLVTRLRAYEEKLREEAEQNGQGSALSEEDEMDRLRYAFVGLVLEAQSTFRRNLSLWARALEKSAAATNRVAQPVTSSFLLAPVQRRIDRLAKKGEQSLARWIAEGRTAEPHSRQLAKMTYTQIVDEFINQLAENPELQALVTTQGISLAGEARDEVRERTVTADNLMEDIVRRILRRPPREELPAPPPEVQRWANLTLDEYKIKSLKDKDSSNP